MSISSFTNEIGTFTKHMLVEDWQYGEYFGRHIFHEITDISPVAWQESRKPAPVWGDHKRPLDYYRSVCHVVEDRPSLWRRFATEGNPPNQYVTIDLYGTDHISKKVTLGTRVVQNPGSDNAYSESITEALNGLASADAGAGADIGQTRKTIDEFAVMAQRFAAALLALKRGNVKLAAKNLIGLTGKNGTRSVSKTISELWLEYIYGIKPLMHDLYELQQIVHQKLNKPVVITSTGRGKFKHEAQTDAESGWHLEGTNSFSAHTTLRATIVNRSLYKLNEAGLINPLAIAWELVPWSFAIDWFVPIGQTLQAITAGCGLQSEGGWTSIHVKTTWSQRRNLTFNGWGFGYVDGGYYLEEGFTFSRYAHADFPLPRLFADTTPYSTVRALNALALVSQLT